MPDNKGMKTLLLFLLSVVCFEASALDVKQNEALQETKRQLQDPQERAAIIRNNREGKRTDAIATITVMGNKDYKEEMYAISAEILDWVVQQENPEKLMERYRKDPVAFLKEMPPAQAQKIKNLAAQIEEKRRKRVPASVAQP